jgi:comEA protein
VALAWLEAPGGRGSGVAGGCRGGVVVRAAAHPADRKLHSDSHHIAKHQQRAAQFLPSDLLLNGADSQRGTESQRGIEPLRVAVHVVGAVQQPGVYHLAAGSRGDDAVRLAGGATSQADLKRVNLAAMLVDGQQLWIPRIGERIPQNTLPNTLPIMSPNAVSGAGAPPNAVPSNGVPALVDINQATVADLDRLPGIGPSTARAIVDHRTRNGPFASVDDLLAVRGIGPAKLAELRALVRV